MRKSLSLLFLLLLVAATVAARPGKDPNAAVRYLNAIGSLPMVAESVLDEITKGETFSALAQFGREARSFLRQGRTGLVMKLLRAGAACSECNFTPDDRQAFDDFIPPFRRIRQLARLARAFAWEREAAGDLEESVDTLCAVFMLGQHVEENGLLISTMIGVACRKIAVEALLEFRLRHPEPVWKERLAVFFQRVPRPAVDILGSMRYERDGVERSLREAKLHPEAFAGLGMDPPKGMLASEAVPVPDVTVRECFANQRVLQGALEMVWEDVPPPLPATLTSDLVAGLVRLKYLRKPVSCPGGGVLNASGFDKSPSFVECSVHGNPDAPSAQAGNEENVRKAKAVEFLTRLAATPEYDRLLDECLKLYDEILALDPNAANFAEKYKGISQRIDDSDNLFVQNVVPNFKKAFETARELQDKIETLLK